MLVGAIEWSNKLSVGIGIDVVATGKSFNSFHRTTIIISYNQYKTSQSSQCCPLSSVGLERKEPFVEV